MRALGGKVAIVTGGGTGLGRKLALELAAHGAQIAILGRTMETLAQAASEAGAHVTPFLCNICDPDDVRVTVEAVAHTFGGVDILINNAATYTPFLLEEASDEALRQTFDTNILGAAFLIRQVIPLMRARGGGDIVNVSSESVLHPFPYLSAYAASKAALEALSLGLRDELRADRIRVMTFRIGSMTGNESVKKWDPVLLERFMSAIRESGHAAYTGPGMSPEAVAAFLVNALRVPTEASVNLLELRSA